MAIGAWYFGKLKDFLMAMWMPMFLGLVMSASVYFNGLDTLVWGVFGLCAFAAGYVTCVHHAAQIELERTKSPDASAPGA